MRALVYLLLFTVFSVCVVPPPAVCLASAQAANAPSLLRAGPPPRRPAAKRPRRTLEVPLRVHAGNLLTIADDFAWRGYCPLGETETLRHVRRPGATFVPLYSTPGGPIRRLMPIPQGVTLHVLHEEVHYLPTLAYRVHTQNTCAIGLAFCVWHACEDPGQVQLEPGSLIIPYLETPWRGYSCDAPGSEWLCDEEDRWMADPSMACLAASMEPITPVAADADRDRLGWWIELEDGWIKGDRSVDLLVSCTAATRPGSRSGG